MVKMRPGCTSESYLTLTTARASINDWLLAEAVRLHEERNGRRTDDGAAIAVAVRSSGGFRQRLIERARALPGIRAVQTDICSLRRRARLVLVIIVLLGVLAGWLAARASMADRQIDLLLALLTLLGLPTLMLIAWIVVMTIGRRSARSGGAIGRLVNGLLTRLAPRLLSSSLAGEVVLATTGLLRAPFGRWALSLLSHLFWLAYAGGALLALAVYFSLAQYDLSWGTTLLAETTVVTLVEILARPADWLGLLPVAIDPEWIQRGREGAMEGSDRAIWARFLIALVVTYGALPRLVLGLLCAGLAWRAGGKLALNTGESGYLRLQGDLMPEQTVSDIHGHPPERPARKPRRQARGNTGPPVLVWIEVSRSAEARPPDFSEIEVLDLGSADRRSQRRELEDALAALRPPPSVLLVVCSLLRTPDEGTERLLNRLADAARSALVLVLTEKAEFERRGGDLAARQADWEALASRVGGEAVLLNSDQPDAADIAEVVSRRQQSESDA